MDGGVVTGAEDFFWVVEVVLDLFSVAGQLCSLADSLEGRFHGFLS